jgi:DNA-directed RNA polymerase specialized sigma24 family protein
VTVPPVQPDRVPLIVMFCTCAELVSPGEYLTDPLLPLQIVPPEAPAGAPGRWALGFRPDRSQIPPRGVKTVVDFLEASDGELLAASRSNPDAFAAFYDRYEGSVVGYFARRTGDPEVTADLTAEVFAAALGASHRYRSETLSAAGWLFAIAHNKLLTSLRRGRVEADARRRLGIREPIELAAEELERVESAASSSGWVIELLDRLPPLGETPFARGSSMSAPTRTSRGSFRHRSWSSASESAEDFQSSEPNWRSNHDSPAPGPQPAARGRRPTCPPPAPPSGRIQPWGSAPRMASGPLDLSRGRTGSGWCSVCERRDPVRRPGTEVPGPALHGAADRRRRPDARNCANAAGLDRGPGGRSAVGHARVQHQQGPWLHRGRPARRRQTRRARTGLRVRQRRTLPRTERLERRSGLRRLVQRA